MNKHIIGDIHGQHEKLLSLLKHLGYRHRNGAWRNPNASASFVGDLIDRGPGQVETLKIVRDMVEAGQAEVVMGNHEFNAICWSTPSPTKDGEFLRPHSAKNRHQHKDFLNQVGEDSAEHRFWVEWFKEIPMWLDHADHRLIHACWHDDSMEVVRPYLTSSGGLKMEHLERILTHGTPEFAAMEVLCKGLEVDLPENVVYQDAEGVIRNQSRLRWWDTQAITYRDAALIPNKEIAKTLPDIEIPSHLRFHYNSEKPLFFGHYWFSGAPQVLSELFCCVDYSAAKGTHPLVAYEWNGDTTLKSAQMLYVK